MISQSQSVCSACRGEGEIIPPKDRCKNCNAKKVVPDSKVLEVHIDKGMKDGQKIVFSGEGDQEPGMTPGDIIIVIDEEEHPVFTRKGLHLYIRMELELVEALCGFQKTIETLDKRHLMLTVLPGEIIKHGDVKCIPGEGMPTYKNPFEKGNLIVQFIVHFPPKSFLPPEKIVELEKILPGRTETMIPDDAEEVTLVEMDPSQERSHHDPRDMMDDDMHGPGVRCAQS
jgi:DnaJ family protein A protein 1